MQLTDYKELFAGKGLKNTQSRNLIYGVLSETGLPMTAEQIFIKLKETETSVNLSTVYRTLELFVEKGLVLKANMAESNKAMFEVNHHDHKHYLVCLNCREMIPVEGCPLEEYEKVLNKKIGFDVTGHKFEIYGYCKNCQMRRTEKEKGDFDEG